MIVKLQKSLRRRNWIQLTFDHSLKKIKNNSKQLTVLHIAVSFLYFYVKSCCILYSLCYVQVWQYFYKCYCVLLKCKISFVVMKIEKVLQVFFHTLCLHGMLCSHGDTCSLHQQTWCYEDNLSPLMLPFVSHFE